MPVVEEQLGKIIAANWQENRPDPSVILSYYKNISAKNFQAWSLFLQTQKQVKVSEEQNGLADKVANLEAGIEALKKELAACRKQISKLSDALNDKPLIKHTQLFELDEEFELESPVPVIIEDYEGEVTARFPEVEAFGVGNTEAEAISDLKQSIRNLYIDLINTPKEQLGTLPSSWLRSLTKVMHRID